MRIVRIEDLTDDMVLAKPIFYNFDTVLLNEGVGSLTKYAAKFVQLGVHYLYVEDALSEGIEIDDVVSDQTRREGRRIVGSMMQQFVSRKQANMDEVQKLIGNLIDDILANKSVFVNIMDLKNIDTYHYYHAVNVAILALLIGQARGYNYKQLSYLGTGAILHDIGIVLLPKTLASCAEADLSGEERRIYRAHAQLGFELLKSLREVDAFSKNIVFGHHEQVDGKGYPRGLAGDQIHDMVKIVSVCDAYDEMTSNLGQRQRLPSYQAIEYLKANEGTKFDASVVQDFVSRIAAFPVGSIVLLSNGARAIVERQNKGFPARPVVRLMETKETVDLLKEVSLVIKDCE